MRSQSGSGFEHAANPRLLFGRGVSAGLATETARIVSRGKRVFLISGGRSLSDSGKKGEFLDGLRREGFEIEEGRVTSEPDADTVDLLALRARDFRADCAIGIGGGSVLDAAKAVAFLTRNPGGIAEYLEGIGTRAPEGVRIPLVAVPTTAGTGSEATKNAPIIVRRGLMRFKKSLRHDSLIPDLAVVDPLLAESSPRKLAVSCGMDALSQLIESFISKRATPLTDSLVLGGLAHAFSALPVIVSSGGGKTEAWTSMSYASYISGTALANAGLCAVHGIAGPAGAETGMAHGALCALLLPPTMERTVSLLAEGSDLRRPGDSLEKVSVLGDMAARFLGTAQGGIPGFLESLRALRGIASLDPARLTEESIARIARQADDKNNPVPLSVEDRIEILRSI